MSNGDEFDDYEIGYGKPPKSGRFKKGTSGNPSGRPKKPTDSVSVLMRELDSKFTIKESGQRKVITKLEGIWKQSVNKAVTGDLKSVSGSRSSPASGRERSRTATKFSGQAGLRR
jgi:hypothetical protein